LLVLCENEPRFLSAVAPLLRRCDLTGLLAELSRDWPPRGLVELLDSSRCDVVAAAARCLGYTGAVPHIPHLTHLLSHGDADVVAAADDALWHLRMCAAGEAARERLARAIDFIQNEQFDSALRVLRPLVAEEPAYAEAHHQIALAHHSRDELDPAEQAYSEVLRIDEDHYAAWAGLGHVRAQQRDLSGALTAYRAALRIHPGLEDLRSVMPHLETAVRQRIVA
jgi:tetratricopeptide (TPR) repeat protein